MVEFHGQHMERLVKETYVALANGNYSKVEQILRGLIMYKGETKKSLKERLGILD